MNSTLPPEAWRSEAFAEDLPDDASPSSDAAPHRGPALLVLWGMLPITLAVAGAAVLTLSGS